MAHEIGQKDGVLTVIAPLELRIDRVIKREQISHDEVMKRVSNHQ